jgi:hypothetical protein
VVKWGRDFLGVHAYLLQNEWQVRGPRGRQQSYPVTPDAAPP